MGLCVWARVASKIEISLALRAASDSIKVRLVLEHDSGCLWDPAGCCRLKGHTSTEKETKAETAALNFFNSSRRQGFKFSPCLACEDETLKKKKIQMQNHFSNVRRNNWSDLTWKVIKEQLGLSLGLLDVVFPLLRFISQGKRLGLCNIQLTYITPNMTYYRQEPILEFSRTILGEKIDCMGGKKIGNGRRRKAGRGNKAKISVPQRFIMNH